MIRGEVSAAKPIMPTVWLHGWGMNSSIWRAVPVAMGPRSVRLDLPGHGAQAWDDRCGGDVTRWAEDVLARAPQRAVWVGWSLGGLLAMEIARIAPERVERLLLMGATPRFVAEDANECGMKPDVFRQFEAGVEQDYALTLQRFLALQVVGAEDARRLRGVLMESVAGAPVDSSALRSGLDILRHVDMRSRLVAVQAPTRVILGAQDRIVPPCVAGIYGEFMPKASVEVLEGVGHAPFLHQPDRVGQWVESW